jgi:hypothetical protein
MQVAVGLVAAAVIDTAKDLVSAEVVVDAATPAESKRGEERNKKR